MRIAVFGSGSWATAIVKIACENHDEVFWWVREREVEHSVRQSGFNSLYLRNCKLERDKIKISTDIGEILRATDDAVLVIPSAFVEDAFADLRKEDFEKKNIISAIKGIVPQKNQIIADFMQNKYDVSLDRQAVISGPSHAEEIAAQRLTYLTVASPNGDLARRISCNFRCHYVSTKTSPDIKGIEYGGVMKNIYALAAGICKGLGYGDNFIAVLIAKATLEISDFLNMVSPCKDREINNSVYLGDLLVTAYSQHSRNRTFGQMIGSGYSVASAQLEMSMIAEGYYASRSINSINQAVKATIPIADAVYRILHGGASAKEEMRALSEIF